MTKCLAFEEVRMRARIGVQAALSAIALLTCLPTFTGHRPSDGTELPTGDVWITQAERIFVPHEALTPLTTEKVDVPLGDTLFVPSTSIPNSVNGKSSDIKVNIFLTLRHSEMSRPGKRALRYRRSGDFTHYGDCFRHRIGPAHCFRWAYQERRR
jgi:hypothetical protein